ncbi:hypothetical protein L1987_44291 [Smallanthus sonchifolius]|uniref:Uncharacterized protein n=1 Tax=Smallanthus sonchifolius TaxID=185202 RepID=A0ACB9GQ25_9ASTR|nr:hypothetical protein L1987_44291 [Smallanthus sonchifolius]
MTVFMAHTDYTRPPLHVPSTPHVPCKSVTSAYNRFRAYKYREKERIREAKSLSSDAPILTTGDRFACVGSSNGDIMIWELGSRERIAHKTFKIWDISVLTMPVQASLTNDDIASINRVTWSPDGKLFGNLIITFFPYN